MPTILESIIDYETDVLMMIAECWGVDLQIDQRQNIAEQLAVLLAQADNVREMYTTLTQPEQQAIQRVASNHGRVLWDTFTHEFGPLREMGAARREKERPHHQPVSVTEALFYKGWIGRAFFESGHGIREFAFLPDEFLHLIRDVPLGGEVKPLKSMEDSFIHLQRRTDDRLLDHACTFLALLRSGLPVDEKFFINPTVPPSFLSALLTEMDLVINGRLINPERVKAFLQAPRNHSFSAMARAWMESRSINEMDFLPDLICEGGWQNRPLQNRTDMLTWARTLGGGWYALDDFIQWVHQNHPDFMRIGGEYDAWLIRKPSSGHFLRGREHWELVEGAYLRWMATGPLVWLGIIEIGKSSKQKAGIFLRASAWAETLLTRGQVNYSIQPTTTLVTDKLGGISIERHFPLHIRYQLARFCEFQGERRGQYHYRLTPNSLKRAEAQGLKTSLLIALLNKYTQSTLPANLVAALESLERSQRSAQIYSAVIMEVPDAALLDRILASPHKRLILERLSPTIASIAPASITVLRAVLLEMGVFSDIRMENNSKPR